MMLWELPFTFLDWGCGDLCTLQNCLYQRGLELAIAQMKASGREPHVLDIGTGTGLLSLMAARAGAACVTACEVSFFQKINALIDTPIFRCYAPWFELLVK